MEINQPLSLISTHLSLSVFSSFMVFFSLPFCRISPQSMKSIFTYSSKIVYYTDTASESGWSCSLIFYSFQNYFLKEMQKWKNILKNDSFMKYFWVINLGQLSKNCFVVSLLVKRRSCTFPSSNLHVNSNHQIATRA